MRHISLTTILAIFGLGLLLSLGSPNTASAVTVKGWQNRVYGEAKVWGLYYNNPWTSSSHQVYIENFQDVTVSIRMNSTTHCWMLITTNEELQMTRSKNTAV